MSAQATDVETIPVAELVGQVLARLGVGHCFGVVGSGNFAVTNALRAAGVDYTAARHEGGAATMADAYARMSGAVALLSVHQGCGLTNAVTGIGEAAKSRTPLLVLAAETAGGAVTSNFAIDQPALARSVGAVSERVHSAASALDDVVRAHRTASRGRRTVVLNLPLDVQAQTVPVSVMEELLIPEAVVPTEPGQGAVARLAAMIQDAERPVIIAGRGGRGAGRQLRELAEQAGALLATSAVAKGLFADEPYSLGISGGFSSPLSAELITGADLVIGFGCAMNMWTMRAGALIAEGAAVVQVDDTEAALGAHRPVDLAVLGDCAATASAVTSLLRQQGAASIGYRREEVLTQISSRGRWRDTETADESTGDRIDPRVLNTRLDDLLPAERIVAIDSGNFMGYPSQYLQVPDEFGFCFTQSFQAIGLGLATAIGAALAQPQRMPVLGTGDGGFLMAISELETAVRLSLPLVVIVHNDAAYSAEVHHFSNGEAEPDLSTVVFPDTDLAAIARGYGATGITVRTASDLDAVTTWLSGDPRTPLVIDAKITSDGGAWWLHEAFKGH